MVFYGILDLLAGPVFLYTHVWQLAALDYSRFAWGGAGTGAGYGTGAGSALRGEKSAAGPGVTGTTV